MVIRFTLITILFSIFSVISFDISAQDQNAEIILKERGEVYFRFENIGKKALHSVTHIVSIDNVDEDFVYAYANRKEFNKFLDLGIDYELLTPPGLLINPVMKNIVNLKEINDWDFYPTYEAYVDMMYQFETDFPDLCEVINIGQTTENRDLLFVRISDNITQDEGEAQFMYTGTMHGDETAGYVVFLRLIDYLLNNYGTDPQVTNLVQNLEIWINPAANPDGTYAGGNNTVYGAIRYNANGIDLNRNYHDPEDGPHPDGEEWQPETLAFMQVAEDNHFTLSSNTHGGAEVCNYPWDTWGQLHADDDWWQYVCHEYADTAQLYSPNGYLSGFNDGITNGWDWYTTNGNRQDYMNYFHQCREFIYEMSNEKLVPADELPDFWEWNYRSLLNYMEQTLFGISGTVTDANTGDPVVAQVFIENHDVDSSMVFTNEFGIYYRPIHAGNYSVTFSATGYLSQTFNNIETENRELTELNVQLVSGDLIADFVASATNIPIGSSIDFTDLTYGTPESWEWTFEGGDPSTSSDQSPENIYYSSTGTFDVSLTVSDGTNSQTISKEDYITASVDFIMQNTTITACEGTFYDSGGLNSNYNDEEDFTMTFLPGEPGSKIKVEFTSFMVEDDATCDYDWLKIYDGDNTSSPLLGTYCGSDSPGNVTATNEQGALTFQFHSDYNVTESGWSANVSCEGSILPPLADFTADLTNIIEEESVQFTDLSSNDPTSWEWTFEGGTPGSSTEQNPQISYSEEGNYSVTLTATNIAGNNTIVKEDYITVTHITGVENLNSLNLKIYPNPVHNVLNIESQYTIKSVTIINIIGETIINKSINSNTTKLELNNMENGIYFLQVNTDQGLFGEKIQILK